jgi:ribosomal protein S18 acetylase RimI-like enzyme
LESDIVGTLTIRPLAPSDETWVAALLTEHWGGREVVSRGRVWDAAALPGFIAEVAGEPAGLLTYRVEGDQCEVVSLDSLREGLGIGSALLEAAHAVAREAGCRRVWLITTNDNIHAIRFYQRRGYCMAALHKGAIDAVDRPLKPSIPEVGMHGIPIRDEIEFEYLLC